MFLFTKANFEYNQTNVWSLEIGLDNFGKEILWVLSDLGLKGYYFDVIQNLGSTYVNAYPLYEDYLFNDLSIREGDKLHVDEKNNIWLSTVSHGLRFVYNNGEIYDHAINKKNYSILSDNVIDVGIDMNSSVYVLSKAGISVLNTNFISDFSPSSLSVSPNPFNLNQNNEII